MTARQCAHPHAPRGRRELLDVPTTPVRPGQLALLTDAGWVPYCGWDCERSLAAATELGQRFVHAHVASAWTLWWADPPVLVRPPRHYEDERFAVPQMVLSQALAEAEERYCVADDISRRMAWYVTTRNQRRSRCICQKDA